MTEAQLNARIDALQREVAYQLANPGRGYDFDQILTIFKEVDMLAFQEAARGRKKELTEPTYSQAVAAAVDEALAGRTWECANCEKEIKYRDGGFYHTHTNWLEVATYCIDPLPETQAITVTVAEEHAEAPEPPPGWTNTDSRLLGLLRKAGDEWGARRVAEVAAGLANCGLFGGNA